MDGFVTYTDKIIEEILTENVEAKDIDTFIDERYRNKGFTLIGVRRERRMVSERINENTSNKFDMISAVSISLMAGVTAFLLGGELVENLIIVKYIFALTTTVFLSILFSNTLSEMHEKSRLYHICNYKLADFQNKLEDEFTRVELARLVEENLNNQCNVFEFEEETVEEEKIQEVTEEENKQNDEEVECFSIDISEEDLDEVLRDSQVEIA